MEVVERYAGAATRARYAEVLDDLIAWSEARGGAILNVWRSSIRSAQI